MYFTTAALCVLSLLSAASLFAQGASLLPSPSPHQEYIDFFEKVYDTMDKNYYYPVSRAKYEKFLQIFDKKIYIQLKLSGKSNDYIRWRSAAYLVDAMKSPEDIFSSFMPPKFAEKYEKEALGKKIDLGIEGKLTDQGFLLSKVEIRSDAYEQGLREKDIVFKIDGVDVKTLTDERIGELLTPLENAKVRLDYRDALVNKTHTIFAVSKEYFKQLIWEVPVDVPGVSCLRLEHFNRMTGEDMSRLLSDIRARGDQHLILDLRGNPGGPPLAAQEISAYFLEPKEPLTYFKWKNKPPAKLDVPEIPEKDRYRGDIAILVNEKSGSASELFTGIMQWRGRAVVMGKNTAGQVFLKSMFDFDDKSMLLLVTARGHRPDGEVFSFKGITPNVAGPEPDVDLVHYAAKYLTGPKAQPMP